MAKNKTDKKNDVANNQKLDKIKKNFLLVASHQLKMPLNVMKLNLQLILGGDLGEVKPAIKDALLEVLRLNRKMIELIGDFLNASAIEKGSKKIKSKPTDIVQIIKETISEAKVLANQKKVIINFMAEPKFPKAKVDSKKFNEVIHNLLSNAVKYNRDGGKVDVNLSVKSKKIILSIADTGIGIPKKDEAKMFSEFFRSENAIKSATEGSGLGLFVVKSYVEAWDGKIWFESVPNKGTTFYFSVPL